MLDFTKEEWYVELSGDRLVHVLGKRPESKFICVLNDKAYAPLVIAAPEMYKFIRTLYELITNPEDDEEGLSFRFIPEAAKQILDRIDGKED